MVSLSDELVSDAAYGTDEPRFVGGVPDGSAEVADMDVDQAFVAVEVPTPHTFDELTASEDPPWCLREAGKELELQARQLDRLAVRGLLVDVGEPPEEQWPARLNAKNAAVTQAKP